ncbi:MAG: nucleotidyltransferase family protein [archaeon]
MPLKKKKRAAGRELLISLCKENSETRPKAKPTGAKSAGNHIKAGDAGCNIDCNDHIDWPAFLREIPSQLIFVVYRNAQMSSLGSLLPDKVKEHLHRLKLGAIKKRLSLVHCLREIDAAFRKENIDYVLLKGFAIEKAVYQKDMRFFEDLDILVRKKDIDRAMKTVKGLGYSEPPGAYPNEYYEKCRYHLVLFKKELGVAVELHSGIAESYSTARFNERLLFNNTVTSEVQGLRLKIFNNEMALIHQCVHSISIHTYQLLISHAYEISGFMRRQRIDWSKLVRICQMTGSAAFVYKAILSSDEIFPMAISQTSHDMLKALERLRMSSDKGELRILDIFYNLNRPGHPSATRAKILKWSQKALLCRSMEQRRLLLADLYQSCRYPLVGLARLANTGKRKMR